MTTATRLRNRLARLRGANMLWTRGLFRFYNLESWRGRDVVPEIRALLEDRPLLLGLCECLGNRLPEVPGYRLIRDGSRKSRANIAAYVRDDVPLEGIEWIDLSGTWPRTQGPGVHEARSYLLLTLGRMHVVVWHQPPKNARNAWTLQLEGINRVVARLAPWRRRPWRKARSRVRVLLSKLRPRLVIGDANRRKGENGPGPDMLATQLGGETYGPWIDCLVAGGQVEVLRENKRGRVDGQPLDSDHRGAVEYVVKVPRWWLWLVKGVQ